MLDDRSGHSRAPIALAGAAALHALVLATASFLPFVDLPQHVAAAQLVLHRRDPALAATYEFALFPAVNVLGLFVMVPLHAVLPEAAAVRVLMALYFAGLAWALVRLGRAAGGSPWSAVLAMVFALNYNLVYGFVSFCLGIPILVLLVSRLADGLGVRARGSTRALVVDALLWWSLALAHVLLFGFALLVLGAWLAMARRAPRIPRVMTMLPGLSWVIGCGLLMRPSLARGSPGTVEFLWHDASARAAEFGRAFGVASDSGAVEWAGLSVVAFTTLLARAGERRPWDGDPIMVTPRRFVRVAGGLGAVLFVALPFSIYDSRHGSHGLFLLYARFLVFLPLLWLPALRAPARVLAPIACALHLGLTIHWTAMLRSVGRQARGLDGAIAALAPYGRVKSLVYEPVPAGMRFEGFLHVASLHQARAHGETDQSFALIPSNPVRYADPHRPYLSRDDEHMFPERFDWLRSRSYDALLIYDPHDAARAQWSAATGRLVFESNGWRVVAMQTDASLRSR